MARKRPKKGSDGGSAALLVVVLFLVVFVPGYAVDVPWASLLVAVGSVAAVAWLLRQLAGPKTPEAQELAARFAAVGAMSGAQFEVFVADLLRAMGHRAKVVGRSGDQGVDVILVRGEERIAIQYKNHKRRIGNKPVQEVYAGAKHHGCSRAWAVAPAGFTEGARTLAKSTGVSLFDEGGIRHWIRQVDEVEKSRKRAA